MFEYEGRDDAAVDSELLDEVPEGGVGRVEHAGGHCFALLGLAEVEDDSR